MAKSPTPFDIPDISKFFSQLNLPMLDVAQVTDAYRKNVEAITQASQLAFAGMQAVTQRQADILRQSLDDYATLLREASTPTSPQDAASRNAQLATKAFETTVGHLREISELISKSNHESFEVINKRVREMLDEVKTLQKGKA